MMWRAVIAKVTDGVNSAAALVCHVLIFIIVAVTVMQVVLRYFLNSPTSWSEEVALLCLIWFGLLAVAVGIRRHEHVAITYLRDKCTPAVASALDYLAQLAMAIFMFVVMFYGNDLIKLAGAQVLPASLLPKWLLYLPTVIGGGLGMVNALVNIVVRDVHFKPQSSLEIEDVG